MERSVERMRQEAAAVWPDVDWGTAMLEQGAFHDVLIAQDVVARVSRSRFAADAMAQRVDLLRRLGGWVGHLEVPVVLSEPSRWADDRSGVLLSFVSGRSRTIGDSIPASGLGDALAAVRRIDPSILDEAVVRSWCGGESFARLVADVVSRELPSDAAAVALRVVDQLLDAEAQAPTGPVHGDLTPFNVRWDGDAAIGLLDWDFAANGDPALDIAGILTTLGTDTARKLCDEETLARAALHRATFPLQIACAGQLHEDERLRNTGLNNFCTRLEQDCLHWRKA